MMSLEGKVALVTGGASGIGEATVRAFAAAGANVAIVDIAQERAEALAAELGQAGGKALALQADASVRDQAQAMVARTVAAFGGLDCAVNCAGGAAPPTPFLERSEAEWRAQIDVNLMAPFFSMQAEIEAMLARGGGAIVNIASGSGLRGNALMTPYNAAKFGVVGLTRSTAIEYGRRGVRVNAVCPGLVQTPKVASNIAAGADYGPLLAGLPMGRMAQPSEIGAANVWLCSPLASFITGVALPVDGGLWA